MTFNFNKIFYNIIRNKIYSSNVSKQFISKKKYSTQISEIKDPFPIFIQKDIQKLLMKITRVDLNYVYRHRKIGKRINPPEYKFLTDKQLQEEIELANQKLNYHLQIPPIILPNSNKPKQLSNDPEIQSNTRSKFVFYDISQNIKHKDRLIYVREPNGILREGNADERFRMEMIFFPRNGCMYNKPKMFLSPYLESLLDREEYEFILDRACIQFEPDDPDYIDIVQKTYKHINLEKKFNKLRSTRHFGGLGFYLSWWNEIDNLLIDQISNFRIDEAAALIQIYQILQPNSKTAQIKYEGKDLDIVQAYVNLDSLKKDPLTLAIQCYIEHEKESKIVEEGQKLAHGL